VRDYLIVLGTALATVVVATPLARWVALATGAVDRPGGRRVHTRPTPRLGGLAIYAGLLTALAVASRLPTFDRVFTTTSDPEAIILASSIIVVVGLVDDIRGLSAPAKLAGQIVAAGTLVLFGVFLRFVYIPGDIGTVALSTDLGVLLTVVAIVAMINSVNLVDGLDGLAAGIVCIAAMALFAYVHLGGTDERAVGLATSPELLFAALVGACLGFLVFNFHPASVFMGDTGAMLLGLLLGAASVSAIGGVVAPSGSDFAALSIPVLVPALVLAVPFFDTTWTILRRLRSGRAVFSPDKKHLHHRLIEIGHSHRRAVLIMYYWSGLLAFGAVAVGLLPLRMVLAILGGGVGLAVGLSATSRLARWVGARRAGHGRPIVFSFTKSSGERSETPSDQRKRRRREL
jgi:UDP-GlcNAc:undecaprenyl-phosphate/decaprenyl-phosphate GlcNAc-1-phosphate transferase